MPTHCNVHIVGDNFSKSLIAEVQGNLNFENVAKINFDQNILGGVFLMKCFFENGSEPQTILVNYFRLSYCNSLLNFIGSVLNAHLISYLYGFAREINWMNIFIHVKVKKKEVRC